MIHRRALITGLLSSVAAPALARLAPDAPDMIALLTSDDGVTWKRYGMPAAVRTYWDGNMVRTNVIPWEELYLPCGQSEPEPDIPS